MPLLARRVKGPLWAKASDPKLWTASEFPFELLADLIDRDGSGISVWEVKSTTDPALKRIAAAMMIGTKANPGREIQSIEFRLVDRARVEKLGITVTTSLGDTRDVGINGLHRTLSGLTAKQAIGLLRLLKTRECVFAVPKSDRKSVVAEGET